jgi:O-acetylserine/cysteine efflux transporter
MAGTRLSPRDGVLLTLICLAWAGNFLTSKLALTEFPPFLFTALRLALLSILLVWFLKPPVAGQWPRLIAVALCNGVLHFGLSFWALQLSTTLASPAIVMQSYVPISALLAWWVLGEKFAWRTGLAIALSFVGVLVLGFDPSVLAVPRALWLMLVSAFFLALGTVLMRDLKSMNAIQLQGWTAVIGVLPLFTLSYYFEPNAYADIQYAGIKGWGGVLYSALIASMVGHGLFFVLIQKHPVSKITPYLLLAPLLAAVLGIVFLNNSVGPRLWLGGAMVLAGVLIIGLRNLAKARVSNKQQAG